MNLLKLITIVMLATLIILPTCYAKKQTIQFPQGAIESFDSYQNQNGLQVSVLFLSKSQVKEFFGKDNIYKQYIPVYVMIKNDSPYLYSFKKAFMNRLHTPAVYINDRYRDTELKNAQLTQGESIQGYLYFDKSVLSQLQIRIKNTSTNSLKVFEFTI